MKAILMAMAFLTSLNSFAGYQKEIQTKLPSFQKIIAKSIIGTADSETEWFELKKKGMKCIQKKVKFYGYKNAGTVCIVIAEAYNASYILSISLDADLDFIGFTVLREELAG